MKNKDIKRGRYSLVFTDSMQKHFISIDCDINTGEIKEPQKKIKKLDLPIIDEYILTHFKDEKELKSYLNSLGYKIPEGYKPRIAYQSNHQLKFLEVIYQNHELYELALLCSRYKTKFSDVASRRDLPNIELRKLVSKAIQSEELWKIFYAELINCLRNPNFYHYLTQNSILGDRALGYIHDYLDSEDETEAFFSARYYLIDTFTAYKPIRGIIVCMQQYYQISGIDVRCESDICTLTENLENEEKEPVKHHKNNNFLSLLSESQLLYLEKHEYFCQLSQREKENIIVSLLSIPWYECVDYTLKEEEIFYFESHEYFVNLPYYEKIEFVNRYFSKNKQKKYQMKKK